MDEYGRAEYADIPEGFIGTSFAIRLFRNLAQNLFVVDLLQRLAHLRNLRSEIGFWDLVLGPA